MKADDLKWGISDMPRAFNGTVLPIFKMSRMLANRQGQRWKIYTSEDHAGSFFCIDPDSTDNSVELRSHLELKCWLQDKEPI